MCCFYICIELFQFALLYVNSEKMNKLMINLSLLRTDCKHENSNGTTFYLKLFSVFGILFHLVVLLLLVLYCYFMRKRKEFSCQNFVKLNITIATFK